MTFHHVVPFTYIQVNSLILIHCISFNTILISILLNANFNFASFPLLISHFISIPLLSFSSFHLHRRGHHLVKNRAIIIIKGHVTNVDVLGFIRIRDRYYDDCYVLTLLP